MPTVNGVGSGLDIEGLIEASLIVRRASIRRLQAKRAELAARQGVIIGLKSRLNAFEAAAQGIKGLASTLVTASSSSADNIGVTAGAKASAGSHEVVVHGLAQAHRLGAAGFVDRSTTAVAASSGTFQVRVGNGATTSVAVSATTTLQELVDLVNAADGDVTASIVNDGSSANPYRMVLSSKTGGAAKEISVENNDTNLNFETNSFEQPTASTANTGDYTGTLTTSGTYTGTDSRSYLVDILTEGAAGVATYAVSLDGGLTWDNNGGAGYTTSTTAADIGGGTTPAGLQVAFSDAGTLREGDRFQFDAFNPTLREPQDAFAVIDGVGVTSSTNSITDAITGLSLSLKKADATKTISITANQSNAGIQEGLQSFISTYNELITGIRSQQTYDANTNTAGTLLGDPVANRILNEVQGLLSREVTGTTGTFKTLTEIGLTADKDGVLSLNTTTLDKAIKADGASVIEVLEGATTSSTSVMTLGTTPNSVSAGKYSVQVTQAATQATIDAGSAMSGSLTANEVLNFTLEENASETTPTQKVFQITLQSGRNLTQVIADLNDGFKAEGVKLTAVDNGGVLRIHTDEYGSDMRLSVFSNQSGVGSTEIGTTTVTNLGVDIAGLIDSVLATGTGSTLTGNGTKVQGLQVKYTGTTLGVLGTVSVVQGAAQAFAATADNLADKDNSPITARDKAIQAEIKTIDTRIIERQRLLALTEKRVRAQYFALDQLVGQLQSQGSQLLGALSSSSNSSSQ